MDASMIADALGGKKFGAGYRCKCPLHEGKSDNSLAVRDGDGTILLHCFGGCQFIDLVAELRSRGLWPDSTPEQKQEWLQRKREAEAESGKTWLVIAESAVARGDSISRKEQQRLTLLRRLYGGQK